MPAYCWSEQDTQVPFDQKLGVCFHPLSKGSLDRQTTDADRAMKAALASASSIPDQYDDFLFGETTADDNRIRYPLCPVIRGLGRSHNGTLLLTLRGLSDG